MKSKRLLKLVGAIVLAALIAIPFAAGCAAPAPAPAPAPVPTEVIKWRMQTHLPAGDPSYPSLVRIAERITSTTNGRLVVEPFPGDSIVPASEEFDGVNDGILDAALNSFMYNKHLFPAAALFTASAGGLTPLQNILWMLEGGGDELAEEMYAFTDVVFVCRAYQETPEVWAHSTVPLKTVSDLLKVKFRAAGDGGEILTRMGVATVFMSSGEIYESIQRGVIDAFESGGPDTNWSRGFHEVADYLYISPSRAPTDEASIIVNKAAWEKLTPELQLAVQLAGRAEAIRSYAEQIINDAGAIDLFINYGVTVEPLSEELEEAFSKAAVEFYNERAAQDPFYAKVLESQQAFQRLCELQNIR